MRAAVVVLALLDVNGFLALRGVNATGPESWLDGGWGRLSAGGDRNELIGVAHAGVDWAPSRFLTLHASGVARHDPSGEHAGLVEAFADVHVERGLDEVRLRAGQFFLPTSRENKDELWQSPYTIHFSALNSWIGEEVRPIGVDLQYRHVTGAGHAVTAGATAFQGNDTMGTLLAWRGWAVGDRLSTYGEVLPLPPTPNFAFQGDGTTAIGPDLDERIGHSGRVRYSVPERGNIQYTYVDNRGDRELYGDEYSWITTFHLLGAELGNADRVIVAAEYMRGKTGMGGRFVNFVDSDFSAGYVLVSAKRNRQRFSARYEIFATTEEDFSPAESNEEDGRSWTLTWMFDLRESLRLAAEFTQVTGARVGAPDPDARSVTLEARYRF